MSLQPGARIGVYEIGAPLGAGGMGEVYRARDTKLNRDVALKILPAAFAADRDRLARFTREAQTLASLNHPHIAQIHGLEDSAGIHALVMELVDGDDLSARIARGPVPAAEAVAIAQQIADALEAAHEQGIVHRDLKPANIKVRPDGAVKVLDFGLAKAMDPLAASGGNPSLSPTLTAHGTFAGIILGTAAYMAPEQARGIPVDKRADIWSFGVVLFELVCGRRLFEGDTVSDTLAAVLRQEIDWTRLPSATPASIDRLLRRCLERDPKRRLRDIGEARIALDQVGTPADAEPVRAAGSSVPVMRRRSSAVWLATAIAAAVAAGSLAVWPRFGPSPEPPTLRVTTLFPPDVGIDPNTYPILAISHDGSTITFAGMNQGVSRLYVRRLTEFDARPLPESEGATAPFFSPDDTWIGFFGDGKLKKTPAAGGPVVTLATGSDIRGGAWTSADTIVFGQNATTFLQEIPASGGSSRQITTLDAAKQERTHRWPSLMPDRKTVLFNVGSVAHPNDYDDATIEAVNLETGKRQLVVQGGRMPKFVAATGDLLYVRGKILYATAVDPKTLQVRGRPRPILDGVMGDPTTGSAFYALSDTGTLVYIPGDPVGALRRFVWTDVDGKATPIDLPPALYIDPRVSRDGRRIAFSVIDATSSNADVWVADPARGTSSRLTTRGVYRTPLWSRDGRRLFYVSDDPKNNRAAVELRNADGSGQPQTIGTFDGRLYIDDISTDGSTLYLYGLPATGGVAGRSTIYRLSTTGPPESKPIAFVSTAADAFGAAVSPEGRWLAFVSDESGRNEVFVQSLKDGGSHIQISTSGGTDPHWSPDGRAVYYLQGADVLSVSIEASGGLAAGKPRRLFGQQLTLQFDSEQYFDVAPDGRLLMMRAGNDRPSTPELRVILNWFADLRRAR